ncbi:MAG TPA: glucose-6-phosphate dehydrogenase assembly protein OpcA [Gemmataceae bacterium]|nr:glucose-6-phosphate dehydrogenase assembly protein OpcA [Gemmataceae bacterium]
MTEMLTRDPDYLVPLRDVERTLTRQMKALQGPGAAPVQRARMANLVIFCNSLEQAILINAQVPEVEAVHPARAILVVGEPSREECDVTARVTVRPINIAGGRAHACAEQVTLHAAGAAVDRLPFAVRALLIGDLPTNLWWAAPQPPPLAGPLLLDLSENAQQIMYDSLGWVNPVRGMAATASWLDRIEQEVRGGRWRVASDLNWRRLKYWRRLLMQALDPASAPGAAESVSEVIVEHGPHAVIQAWELCAWLTRRLGWRLHTGKVSEGVEMAWVFSTPHGPRYVRVRRLPEGPPQIRRVRMTCTLDGKAAAMNLVPEESGRRLAIELEGVDASPRTMSVPPQSAAELIGRQLSDRERDAAFRESMTTAQGMAQSLL